MPVPDLQVAQCLRPASCLSPRASCAIAPRGPPPLMSGTFVDPRLSGRAPPRRGIRLSWSDPLLRNIVWQVLIVGAVAGVIWYLIDNTNRNLAARRIATGFAFLGRIAGIPIGEHLIDYDPAIHTYGRALVVGILNTLKVSVVGIVLATLLGTIIGIGRLSR